LLSRDLLLLFLYLRARFSRDTAMGEQMRSRSRARITYLLVLSLVIAACGTRLTTEEQAFYADAGPDGVGTRSGTVSSSDDASTSGEASSSLGSSTPVAGTSTEGTAPVNGEERGGAEAAAALPCGAASTEIGVTDETITLGGVFQLSGLLPGFAQTAAYGAQAYVDFLNATGGLCGRQVDYVVLDDGFDASRNAEQTGALIKRAVSLDGGFSAADDGAATVLAQSNVIDVAVGTTPARQQLPNHYPLLGPENTADAPDGVLPEYRYAVENGATKLAIVTVNAAAGRATAAKSRDNARSAGMEVVLDLEVSPTQFSYASTARAIADSGAQMALALLEINGSVQLAEELARVDHSVKYAFYRLGYDQRFIDSAGSAAEGAVNFLEFLPFEEAGTNERLDAFLQYYDQVAPGVAPTFQAMQGWVAMELYSQVIRSLGGPITRDALSAAAKNLGEVDGRGLFANFDFGSRIRPACKVVVRVVNGRYQREAAASGFYC